MVSVPLNLLAGGPMIHRDVRNHGLLFPKDQTVLKQGYVFSNTPQS